MKNKLSRLVAPGLRRRSGFLGLLLAIALASSGNAEGIRSLSPDQQAIIDRNASLRRAFSADPGLVYRSVQSIERMQANNRAGSMQGDPPRRPSRNRFDPRRDPDLNTMERVAPEAAYDLFLLLKKAQKDKKSQQDDKPVVRPQ